MLRKPLTMILPEVIRFKLSGELGSSITATDLVLTITQMLKVKEIIEKFVEFFSPGIENLTLTDRATISHIAP